VATYVLERIDALRRLLDLASNDLRNELGGELRESAAGSLARHDLRHLLPDRPDLRAGSVCGLLDLVGAALRECDTEEAEEVIVGCLDDNVRLNESLPFPDQRPQLVRGEVEAVEVGEAVLALDFVDAELDLSERVVLIFLQIRQRNLENPTLQSIVRVLQTRRPVHERLSNADDGVSPWRGIVGAS